jgi:uncharacterized protein (DUF2147 family)
MKRLFASAAVLATALLASSAAQAQYTIDYGGRTIRIDPDRGTVSIPGVYDNTGRPNRRNDRDYERSRKRAPAQAKVDPKATPPVDQPPAATTAPATPQPAPPNAQANVAPADAPAPAAAATPRAPPAQQDATPAAPPAPPAVATAPSTPATAAVPPPPAPAQQQQAARTTAPATATPAPSNSPLGLWLTEQKEGKVRIEQCGANLCGYSVDPTSNQNGEQVLINMKPGKDAKWSGRIYDPKSGSTYDSTLAMQGSDALRVQGCAFSGMFCGGQTWTRLN